MLSPVSLGVAVGLIAGKVTGVYGLSLLGIRLGLYSMPKGMNSQMPLGTSFLTGVGLTMSLFINSMAFDNPLYIRQAKTSVLFASLMAGTIGYLILRKNLTKRSTSAHGEEDVYAKGRKAVIKPL